MRSYKRDFVRKPMLRVFNSIDPAGGHNLPDPESGVKQGGFRLTSIFQKPQLSGSSPWDQSRSGKQHLTSRRKAKIRPVT